MGWRREEVWLDVDVHWFGEPAVAGFTLPPLPSFGPVGLAASRQRREAWKRRRRARATALMVLPVVMVPPALFRSGGAAGARIVMEDPPSLTLRIPAGAAGGVPAAPALEPERSPKTRKKAAPSEESPKIDWKNATSVGIHWSGSLLDGTQLPVEGPDWITWNPVTDSSPNAPRRLYGNERTIRTILSVIEGYRAAHPKAPRVVVGDISFEGGGPMEAHVSHQNGLDVDIYYPRLDRSLREPRLPSAIDRRLSQDLLDRFIAAGASMVFVGYATDLRGPERIVIPYPNHENHMHVRFPPLGG
jgi:penicillin-insensitive murein endopeptidase